MSDPKKKRKKVSRKDAAKKWREIDSIVREMGADRFRELNPTWWDWYYDNAPKFTEKPIASNTQDRPVMNAMAEGVLSGMDALSVPNALAIAAIADEDLTKENILGAIAGGRQLTPSKYIRNPYLGFAADMLLDVGNIAGGAKAIGSSARALARRGLRNRMSRGAGMQLAPANMVTPLPYRSLDDFNVEYKQPVNTQIHPDNRTIVFRDKNTNEIVHEFVPDENEKIVIKQPGEPGYNPEHVASNKRLNNYFIADPADFDRYIAQMTNNPRKRIPRVPMSEEQGIVRAGRYYDFDPPDIIRYDVDEVTYPYDPFAGIPDNQFAGKTFRNTDHARLIQDAMRLMLHPEYRRRKMLFGAGDPRVILPGEINFRRSLDRRGTAGVLDRNLSEVSLADETANNPVTVYNNLVHEIAHANHLPNIQTLNPRDNATTLNILEQELDKARRNNDTELVRLYEELIPIKRRLRGTSEAEIQEWDRIVGTRMDDKYNQFRNEKPKLFLPREVQSEIWMPEYVNYKESGKEVAARNASLRGIINRIMRGRSWMDDIRGKDVFNYYHTYPGQRDIQYPHEIWANDELADEYTETLRQTPAPMLNTVTRRYALKNKDTWGGMNYEDRLKRLDEYAQWFNKHYQLPLVGTGAAGMLLQNRRHQEKPNSYQFGGYTKEDLQNFFGSIFQPTVDFSQFGYDPMTMDELNQVGAWDRSGPFWDEHLRVFNEVLSQRKNPNSEASRRIALREAKKAALAAKENEQFKQNYLSSQNQSNVMNAISGYMGSDMFKQGMNNIMGMMQDYQKNLDSEKDLFETEPYTVSPDQGFNLSFQDGGMVDKVKMSYTGYRKNSKDKKEDMLRIPGNKISMDNVDKALMLIPDVGEIKIAPPNSGTYYFPGATEVLEIPIESKEQVLPEVTVASDDPEDETITLPEVEVIAKKLNKEKEPGKEPEKEVVITDKRKKDKLYDPIVDILYQGMYDKYIAPLLEEITTYEDIELPVIAGEYQKGGIIKPTKFLSAIDATESGGDYSALFSFVNKDKDSPFYGFNATEMTIGDLLSFSDKDSDYYKMMKQVKGPVGTPVGRYQIVNRTLKGIVDATGMSKDVKFTPEVQDDMGMWLALRRIERANKYGYKDLKPGSMAAKRKQLRNEWYGLRKISDRELNSIIRDIENTGMTSDDVKERLVSQYRSGGKIKIKPENRGKFTAAAKRAGMGVQAYARHVLANKEKYSPTLIKRANFARNAAKWKKQDGGEVEDSEEDQVKQFYREYINSPGYIQNLMTQFGEPLGENLKSHYFQIRGPGSRMMSRHHQVNKDDPYYWRNVFYKEFPDMIPYDEEQLELYRDAMKGYTDRAQKRLDDLRVITSYAEDGKGSHLNIRAPWIINLEPKADRIEREKIYGADVLSDLPSTLAHETSHALQFLYNYPVYDLYPLMQRSKIYKDKLMTSYWDTPKRLMSGAHDDHLLEIQADLQSLRYNMWKDKIYDSTEAKRFTPDDLKKVKKKYKNTLMYKRLKRHYNDADLIDIMNSVADVGVSSGIQNAKMGGKISDKSPAKYQKGSTVKEKDSEKEKPPIYVLGYEPIAWKTKDVKPEVIYKRLKEYMDYYKNDEGDPEKAARELAKYTDYLKQYDQTRQIKDRTFKIEYDRAGKEVLSRNYTPQYYSVGIGGLEDTLKEIPEGANIMFMDHIDDVMFGYPKEDFMDMIAAKNPKICIGGTCYGESYLGFGLRQRLPDSKVMLDKDQWQGFRPYAKGEDAIIYTEHPSSYQSGGSVSPLMEVGQIPMSNYMKDYSEGEVVDITPEEYDRLIAMGYELQTVNV